MSVAKVLPHLWFDKEAKAAAAFYCSVFPESRVESELVLRNTPSGDCEVVSFNVWGLPFKLISAGPLFRFNPSISFMVNFDPSRMANPQQELDRIWSRLIDGGTALMPLGSYPFSARYGWLQDKYGVSWQLILTSPNGQPRPAIAPSLLFGAKQYGNAEEATQFYVSVFADAPGAGQTRLGQVNRRGPGQEPEREGTLSFSDFQIAGQWMGAMESIAFQPTFNEAISLVVECQTQSDIDYYWERLSAVPAAEQCGWLKDKYGVSWQVVPAEMNEMMAGTDAQIGRVTKAFLKMKKFNIAELRRAFESGDC